MNFIIAFLLFILAPSVFAKDYSEKECPVVGNTKFEIFHVKGCPNYIQMLERNRGSDNRKCFKNHAEADLPPFFTPA